MSLDDIVNVTITALTKQLTQLGFGTPLIMRYHTAWSALSREFSTTTEMISAGLSASDPAVLMATKMWSQTPRPATIKIGKRTHAFTQIMTITPIKLTEGFVYTFTIGGFVCSITNGASETVATICAKLVTEINGHLTGLATATDGTTHVDVATTAAGSLLEYINPLAPEDCTIKNTTADPGIATDLDAVEVEDPDGWYGLLLDSNSAAEVAEAAEWAEARTKLFLYNSSDSDCVNPALSTDIASVLQLAAYGRTAGLFSKTQLLSWSAAAWMARMLPTDPGKATWCYKTLAGITVDSTLTGGEQSALLAKAMGEYIRIGGVNFANEGKVAAGEWIDVVIFIDWLKARMQERIMSALLNNDKIPYTDSGVDTIVGMVKAQLQQGVRVGGLAADPAPTVTAPKVADIDDSEKALRRLPDVNFTGTLAGAIHKLVINGVISL